MAVISYKHNFIYALAPRTASTATADYLIKRLDAEWVPKNDVLDDGGIIKVEKKHSAFKDLIQNGVVDRDIVKSFLTFITVRNPFDSLFSAWYKKKFTYTKLMKEKDSFIFKKPGFLEDMLFVKDRTFSEWIVKNYQKLAEDGVKRHLNGKFLHHADRVMRFESLNEDFKDILQEYDISYPGKIPIINQTEGKPKDYRQHYTTEARAIVEQAYSLDLKKFSYEF